MKKISKYHRYCSVTFELNPLSWTLRPSYYRFKHEQVGSSSREGSIQWLFLFISWSRDPK